MSADRELVERARVNVRNELIPIPGGDGPASYRSVTLSPYDMARLLALASAGADANEATDEFNAGYECAKAGGKITDEPNHCPQDEWSNGFLCGDYDSHAAAARLAGVRDGIEAAKAVVTARKAACAADFYDAHDHEGMTHGSCEGCNEDGRVHTELAGIDAAAVAARGRG